MRTRTDRSPQAAPREPGRPSEHGDARGDGAACPLGVAGTAGSWERRRTGTELEAGVGHVPAGRKGGGAGPGEAGCTSGSGGVAGSVALARPPRARLPRGPGGPRHCQMLCSCLRRFLSLHAPHPPGSSSLRFLGGESGGDLPRPPLLRPRLPEPPGLSAPAFGSFTLGLTAPPPSSHHSAAPRSFSSPASCPTAPDPGGLLPSLASRSRRCLLRSWLRARLAPRAEEGRRQQRRASLIAFLLLPLPAFPIVPQRRDCSAPDQPQHHGQGKAGRAAGSVAVGCGSVGCGSRGDARCRQLTPTAGRR